jgi:hypothetical protein
MGKGIERWLDMGVEDAGGARRADDPDWIGRLATDDLDSTAFPFPLRLAPSYNSDPKPTSRPLRDRALKIAFLLYEKNDTLSNSGWIVSSIT